MNDHSIWMNPTWDGKTFPERVIREGALPISDATMALFQPYLASPLPADQLVLSLEDRRQIVAQPEMALAMRAMTEGAGFVLLRVPDAALHCSRTMTRIGWLASSAFGQPITQNREPLFIYDVKDVGGSLDGGHRLSQTNKTTGFHTDGSFHAESLDLVALLCLQRAKEGGDHAAHQRQRGGGRAPEQKPACLRAALQAVPVFEARGVGEGAVRRVADHLGGGGGGGGEGAAAEVAARVRGEGPRGGWGAAERGAGGGAGRAGRDHPRGRGVRRVLPGEGGPGGVPELLDLAQPHGLRGRGGEEAHGQVLDDSL